MKNKGFDLKQLISVSELNIDINELVACQFCKHHFGGMSCEAYPNGIPIPIQEWDTPHTEPLPGDNGIIFERAEMISVSLALRYGLL